MTKAFLTAEWRKLVMANYAVDPKILGPRVPNKTELDLWSNTCYVSLVGFMFLNTKIKGLKIPFHVNFEEVNLRFYVKHRDGAEWKRGVVFLKEIVPRPALTFVANKLYKEHYQTMPMHHRWELEDNSLSVRYRWKSREWNSFGVRAALTPTDIRNGSEEEFITEHYWGYTRIGEQETSEYRVDHPRWQIYNTEDYSIAVDFGEIYGQEFDFLKNETPRSVFLAEGSEVVVRSGIRI
jgi:uncharacterized protein YqjF (DUF2071 family)